MSTYIDVKAAIQQAKTLLGQKERLLESLGIVRSDLRNAVKMGGVSSEDAKWIGETFPVHERTRKAK